MNYEDIIEVKITLQPIRVSDGNREPSKLCSGCIAEIDTDLCSNLPKCETNEGSFIFKAVGK